MTTEQQILLQEQEAKSELDQFTQESLFELLMNEEDISWQTMLYELVRTEKMDPWDIDVSLLTKKFIGIIRKLKKVDFRITGKMVLAAAILLKIKSNRLMSEDLSSFDQLLHSTDEQDQYMELSDSDGVEFIKFDYHKMKDELPKLIPRVPQPRKRKVSIFDIVKALEQALEVQTRRTLRQMTLTDNQRELPKVEHKEISLLIQDVYSQLIKLCGKKRTKILFEELLPDTSKEAKIYTFVPLLHLTNQRKTDLFQEEHFGPIEIELLKEGALKKAS